MKCNVITVKFLAMNEPRQEIRACEIMGGTSLDVMVTLKYLVVDYMSVHDKVLKRICFNFQNVKEYCLEGVINGPDKENTIRE